tara:strand:- start:790 stop:1026 length:237 start_codon:yes stop_codon:yes gene_type:complete
MSKDAHNYWRKKATKLLLNKKIVKVEWMNKSEQEEIGWHSRPLCMQLDDGTWIFPMADDEGNDGGALAVGESETLPVF